MFGVPSKQEGQSVSSLLKGDYSQEQLETDPDLGKSVKEGWRNLGPSGRVRSPLPSLEPAGRTTLPNPVSQTSWKDDSPRSCLSNPDRENQERGKSPQEEPSAVTELGARRAGRTWDQLAEPGTSWQNLGPAGRIWEQLAEPGTSWQNELSEPHHLPQIQQKCVKANKSESPEQPGPDPDLGRSFY